VRYKPRACPSGSQATLAGAEIVRQRACDESVAGFERVYGFTFYAAILALVLGTLLPGWPFAWAGRRAADAPASAAH
jgi:hypothetical protein